MPYPFPSDTTAGTGTDIDQAFIEQYNADVHHEFAQRGPRLIGMTRKGTVRGKSAIFQKVGGKLVMVNKPRRGTHEFGAVDHDTVKVDMVDKYLPTAVDELDLLKQNIDERRAHAVEHVGAVSRYVDTVILGAIEDGAHADVGDAAAAFGYGHAMRIVNRFQTNEVPDDGQRYCALHPYAWSQFLQVDAFANADYVGAENLPFKGGMTAKMWMGVLWFPLNNILHGTQNDPANNIGPNISVNLAWHRSVVGHGVNKEPSTRWSYENTMSAYAAVTSISMGATIIQGEGAMICRSLSPEPVI